MMPQSVLVAVLVLVGLALFVAVVGTLVAARDRRRRPDAMQCVAGDVPHIEIRP